MESVGSFEAKTHLPQLLERVAQGEEFTITKHGKPVARLVSVIAGRPKPDVRQVIEELKAFSQGNSLGEGTTIRDLIEEGRPRSSRDRSSGTPYSTRREFEEHHTDLGASQLGCFGQSVTRGFH
jgi:prevent-host-death family protein